MKHNNCFMCKHFALCLRLIANNRLKHPSSVSKRTIRRHIAREFTEHLSRPSVWTNEDDEDVTQVSAW